LSHLESISSQKTIDTPFSTIDPAGNCCCEVGHQLVRRTVAPQGSEASEVSEASRRRPKCAARFFSHPFGQNMPKSLGCHRKVSSMSCNYGWIWLDMVGYGWIWLVLQKMCETSNQNIQHNMKPSHRLHAGEPTTSSTRRRSCAQCRATALSPMKRAPEV
jgi:hypothetical protein